MPDLIPQDQLPELRRKFELLAERMRAADPSWDDGSSTQPRLVMTQRPLSALIDAETIACVELWLPGGEVHRISSQLLGVPSASSFEMMMLCSPQAPVEPTPLSWHRDFQPAESAPLPSFADCTREGCPFHISWNIPLYDDSLFGILPGSHLAPVSPELAQMLDAEPGKTVPGAVQLDVRAGDGVAKITPVMHWASCYSNAPLRRTIHGNYNLGNTQGQQTRADWMPLLRDEHRRYFAQHEQRSALQLRDQEAALRCVLGADEGGFRAALGRLIEGGGEATRDLLGILLHKTARQICALHHPQFFVGPGLETAEAEQARAQGVHPPLMQPGWALAERFTAEEAERLWACFGNLDAALQDPEEAFARGLRPDHQLRELRQKFGDGEAEQGSPYRFFSSPPRGAVARALFPEAAARRKQFEEEGFVRRSISIDPATFPIERFLGGAQVLVKGLLTGSDLESLEALTQSLIDGTLQPEGDYKGFRPDHFYTFWEPGFEDRTDLPRSERIRLMSNMYHHHPAWRAVGQHPAIVEVVKSLYQSDVMVMSDTVFVKPARHGIEAALHQDTAFGSIGAASEPNSMNFWLAIDRATVENGCVCVVPRSHTTRLRHHKHPVQGNTLQDSEVANIAELTPIEMEPGDGLFFDSALVHKTNANTSPHGRRAYTNMYASSHGTFAKQLASESIAEATPVYEWAPVGAAPRL